MHPSPRSPAYRGRFAPSPTGPLHFGSLVAAAASFADARAARGEWLVRIEDIDPPREVPGAADDILRTLDRLGLEWDGAPMRQSARTDAYREALATLQSRGLAFGCACTRKEIADARAAFGAPGIGVDGTAVYPGTCRNGAPPGRAPRAVRLRVDDASVAFDDAIQGRVAQSLATDVGDFVLQRADGQIAYQLAVVVDDAAQGITDVVRGADLLASTPRQIHLQRLLGLPTPRYAHVPVAATAAGEKLSKQTLARAIDATRPGAALARALRFLGQPVPAGLDGAAVREVVQHAIAHWDRGLVPRVPSIAVDGESG